MSCPGNGKCLTRKLVQISYPRSRKYIIPEKNDMLCRQSGESLIKKIELTSYP